MWPRENNYNFRCKGPCDEGWKVRRSIRVSLLPTPFPVPVNYWGRPNKLLGSHIQWNKRRGKAKTCLRGVRLWVRTEKLYLCKAQDMTTLKMTAWETTYWFVTCSYHYKTAVFFVAPQTLETDLFRTNLFVKLGHPLTYIKQFYLFITMYNITGIP